jgi:HAD superfamily hydrolase (TIGR01549 family)
VTDLDTVVMDIDGTLVDSNYQHILAWHRAFTKAGVGVDLWTIHRAMGMGGDKLVPTVAGDEVEHRQGDDIRETWRTAYDDLLGEVRAFDGATELLEEVERRGLKLVIATSGHPDHTHRSLDILGLSEDSYVFTTSEDAEQTKPAPDLIRVALDKVSGEHGVVVGDTVWDVQAARGQGLPAISLLSGGFSECALRDAGAVYVSQSPSTLIKELDQALAAAEAALD